MNSTQLKTQARRAYEVSRLISASKFLWITLPILVLSLLTCGSVIAPILLGVALSLLVVGSKWRGMEFGIAVKPGLIAGAIAFAIPLVFHVTGLCCRSELEIEICLLSGLIGGAVLGRQVGVVSRKRWKVLSIASFIAILTAALGCLSLGIGAVAGLSLALVVSAAIALFANSIPKV